VSNDCRNDCIEPLIFPKRPENRPGLSHIDYRIGTYSDFREVLLRNLNKDAVLSAWTHRGSDDPGIALLEGASILGDILTFYQELYANEAYLRTAQWRESIADLVRLLGYRLSPGLGGKATFAFEVKGDKPVVIPADFSIKAQVEGTEQPVDFETMKETIAYPSISRFNLYRHLYIPMITQVTKEFYIFSPDQYLNPVKLEKGDRLMIGDPYPVANPTRLINSEVVIVGEIRELHGRKLYKIKGALKRSGSTSEIAGFKLGRSFHHFGYNAPKQDITISSDGTVSAVNVLTVRRLSAPTKFDFTKPKIEIDEFPLAEEVKDLPSGGKLLIQSLQYTVAGSPVQRASFTHVRTIKDITSITMRWGALSGASSLITLNAAINESPYSSALLDRIHFHEVLSPLLKLHAGVQETSMVKGNELCFYGTDTEVQSMKGRNLLFEKPGAHSFIASVTSIQSLSPAVSARPWLRRITLDRDVNYTDFPNETPIVNVYGNLTEATQGKTEKEAVLGNGDNRQKFQAFKLPKAPLTYHNSPGETPPEVPELQIYVNDRLWKMAPSFFGRSPKEEIYIVREDANGDSWVQFGDGKTGVRLHSGIRNVVAKYRTGTGAYGALKEETTVQPGGKLNRLDKIQLPGVASGGSEPESGDNAREAAPGKIQSLDRLVSLKDFESEALAISGITKVKATWDLVDNTPAVVLTVLMETGRDAEFSEIQGIINNYNKCRGPQRFHVDVRQGKRLYVYIDAAFGLHPAFREELVKKSIKEALGISGKGCNGIDGSHGLFGLPERQFGQNEYATRIEGIIQNVEGVVWAEVKALGFLLGESDDPAELILPPEPKPLTQVVSCDNLYILNLYKDHLQMKGSKVESTEEC